MPSRALSSWVPFSAAPLLCQPSRPLPFFLDIWGFKVGVPWPSRFHLGSDLAQTFHAGQFSRCHLSCYAAHGAQVRLVMSTHQALGISAPSAIKMQPCLKSSSSTASQSTVASAKRYMGGAGPGGGGNAQPGTKDTCARHGVESADAWRPNVWGAGPASYYLCPSSYSPKATGSKPQG